MADTLLTISTIASDPVMLERFNASAAQENAPGDPVVWVWDNRYHLAAAPGWAAAVDSWQVGNPDAGNAWAADQSVISDGMITAQVQELLAD